MFSFQKPNVYLVKQEMHVLAKGMSKMTAVHLVNYNPFFQGALKGSSPLKTKVPVPIVGLGISSQRLATTRAYHVVLTV